MKEFLITTAFGLAMFGMGHVVGESSNRSTREERACPTATYPKGSCSEQIASCVSQTGTPRIKYFDNNEFVCEKTTVIEP